MNRPVSVIVPSSVYGPSESDVDGIDDEDVSGITSDEHLGAEALAQAENVGLKCVPRLRWWVLAPDVVDQRIGGNNLVRLHQQVREDGPLLRSK